MAESGYMLALMEGVATGAGTTSIDFAGAFVTMANLSQAATLTGKGYIMQTSTEDLGASSWIDMQLNTPSTEVICICDWHLNNSGGIARAQLYEATTATTIATGSSEITVINRNRNSTNASDIEVFGDPEDITASTYTQVINIEFGSTGDNKNTNVGIMNYLSGMELKQNTTYYFRLYNASANDCYAHMHLAISQNSTAST